MPLTMVASFGADALMVEGHPHEVTHQAAVEYPGFALPTGYPLGLPLLSPEGSLLGRVGDYRFNFQSGQIEELLLRGSFWQDLLAGSRRLQMAAVAVFGKDALILATTG